MSMQKKLEEYEVFTDKSVVKKAKRHGFLMILLLGILVTAAYYALCFI